jgi:hypothetical protein
MGNGSMDGKKSDDNFPANEAAERFKAALRGARLAGPQHKESVTPKPKGSQSKKRKKKRS